MLVEPIRRAGANPERARVTAALESLGRDDLGDDVINDSAAQRRVEPSVDVTLLGRGGRLMK